jgi:hypothetical protein
MSTVKQRSILSSLTAAAVREIGHGAPPGATRRERDNIALNWLADELAAGTHTKGWPFTRETWSTILRRRLTDKYPREKLTHPLWMQRHFHLRRLYCDETRTQSAKHVSELWTKVGSPVSVARVRRGASGKSARDAALKWIVVAKLRLPKLSTDLGFYPPPQPNAAPAPPFTDSLKYEALERAIELIAPDFRQKKKRKSR